MGYDKIFTCLHCDKNISVHNVRNQDEVTCPGCSRRYKINFIEAEAAWELIPIHPPGESTGEPAERDEEHPFRVLQENAGIRDDDVDKL